MPVLALPNPRRGVPGIVVLPAGGYRRARAELQSWPAEPEPLLDHQVPGLAAVRMMATDAAERRAGAYVVLGLLIAELARAGVAPAVTRDDLESGRYADAARDLAVACAGSPAFADGAADATRRFGARVASAEDADALHATDLSRPGLTEPPRLAMQALRLAVDTALDAWPGPPPTHVLVAAAGPALAAATSVQLRARLSPSPALVLTLPNGAAPDALEARLGPLAWQELERGAAALLAATDGGPLAALLAAMDDPAARAALGLDAASRVLLLGSPTCSGGTPFTVFRYTNVRETGVIVCRKT